RFLERPTGGIRNPRVVVALVDADLFLDVGDGLVDRRDRSARGRVGVLAGMDRTRLELHARSLASSEPGNQPTEHAVQDSWSLEPREVAAAGNPAHLRTRDQLRRVDRGPERERILDPVSEQGGQVANPRQARREGSLLEVVLDGFERVLRAVDA